VLIRVIRGKKNLQKSHLPASPLNSKINLHFLKNKLLCISMQNLQTILQILRLHKPDLQAKYPIARMGIFGSYARGEAGKKSDVDIAVEITGSMGLNFILMADEIESLLGIKTDVVPLRAIKPKYRAAIEKDIIYV
jgi:uncharacterized protein